MNYIKHLLLIILLVIIVAACANDDDGLTFEQRDPLEVFEEDLLELNAFLQTHTFNEQEFQNTPDGEDFQIEFLEIQDGDTSSTPLSQIVETRTLRRGDIDLQYFVLNVRQGAGERSPTIADSALVSFRGSLLDGSVFDNSDNPIWFDLPGTVDGFAGGLSGFSDATSNVTNADGTVSFSGGGVGAVFMPSGLGFFGNPQSGIPAFSPIIFTFQLRRARITDHDDDGILSIFEDIDGDLDVTSPGMADNTDGDVGINNITLFNYLDADDDNDGIPTRDENADPNGDGNPEDALDSDGDGIPDYLDNRTE